MSQTEPIAWLNGHFVPISEAKVSVFDLGLVQGAAVTEMIRTFQHEPFHLADHLHRLQRSLRAVGFGRDLSFDRIQALCGEVLEYNGPLIPEHHDLGLVLFVTAGTNLTYVGAQGLEAAREPTLCIHTFPLPFELWAPKFETGQHLVTPSVRHIPPTSLDPKIKYRSRLHWYLADQEARLVDPSAGSLALDHFGHITETSSGNFFIVAEGKIQTPGQDGTLGGVSQEVVKELAAKLGIEYQPLGLTPYDVFNADEAFTSSTPYCILPVTKFNGRPIGNGKPGPVFKKLVAAWNDLVGLDIVQQMSRGAKDRLHGKE